MYHQRVCELYWGKEAQKGASALMIEDDWT
jgi:hypothetical protein